MRRGFRLTVGAIFVIGISIQSMLVMTAQTTRDNEVEFVGRYSNVKYTFEHAYGYELHLWRDGKSIIGLWHRTHGRPSDFPVVPATVSWDESTGSLRFSAKWCDEVESFEGVLENGRLAGTITNSWPLKPAESSKLVLANIDDDLYTRPRGEWRARIDKILKARGPKC